MSKDLNRLLNDMEKRNRRSKRMIQQLFDSDIGKETYYSVVKEKLSDPINQEIVFELFSMQQGNFQLDDYFNYERRWGFRPTLGNLTLYFSNRLKTSKRIIKSRIDEMESLGIMDVYFKSSVLDMDVDIYTLDDFACNYVEYFIIPMKVRSGIRDYGNER